MPKPLCVPQKPSFGAEPVRGLHNALIHRPEYLTFRNFRGKDPRVDPYLHCGWYLDGAQAISLPTRSGMTSSLALRTTRQSRVDELPFLPSSEGD
jgi:hypothetical protein